VGKGVVDDEKLFTRIAWIRSFLQIGNKRGIVVEWPLLDYVSNHIGKTAIRNIDLVAGCASVFIAETVIKDEILGCSRLQQMSDFGVMRVVVAENESADISYVHVMGLPVAESIESELCKFNGDGAGERRVSQNAFFIVMKIAIADGQIVGLLTNARSIVVRHGGAAEFDIFYCSVSAGDDPDSFALGIQASSINMSTRTAHTLQGEVGSRPRAHITDISDAGVDLDGVSRCCRRDGRAWSSELFPWTHLQNGRTRRQG